MNKEVSHVTLAAIVKNTTGKHLYDIAQATGGIVLIVAPADARNLASEADCFTAAVRVVFTATIDLRQPVPAAVAECLLKWAAELMDAGDRVVDVAAVVPPSSPVAYVVRDKLTRETMSFPFHELAVGHAERLSAMRHTSEIDTRPAHEVPEVALFFGGVPVDAG